MYMPTQIFFTAKQNDQDPDLEQYLHNYDVCSKKVSTCILYIHPLGRACRVTETAARKHRSAQTLPV